MRHNRGVRNHSRRLTLLLLSGLVACGDAPQPDPDPQALPSPFDGAPTQLAWQGLLACADCDGIDTQLILDRGGTQPRYALMETFLHDEEGERFSEQGRWRREGRLLRLRADAGGQRVYAIELDGRLSLRRTDGSAPPGEARLLEPVTPQSGP